MVSAGRIIPRRIYDTDLTINLTINREVHKAGARPYVYLVVKPQKWGFERRNALKDPNKERDDLCKQIERAMDLLYRLKNSIEADNINEAAKLVMPLKTMGANLHNDVKNYVDQSNIRGAHNIR